MSTLENTILEENAWEVLLEAYAGERSEDELMDIFHDLLDQDYEMTVQDPIGAVEYYKGAS